MQYSRLATMAMSLCALAMLGTHSWAAGIPVGLVEVTPKNKPKCVEYYTVKGKMFCSTQALSNSNGGVTQYNYDRLSVKFDQRTWVPAWGKKAPDMVTVEYVVKGDDINSWDELVTSQYMSGFKQRPTAPQFAETMLTNLKKQVPNIQTQYLSKSPQEVIFEFKVDQPKELAQHEIQRVFWKDGGMYAVHYVIKKPDMGAAARTKWVALLKQATPKP